MGKQRREEQERREKSVKETEQMVPGDMTRGEEREKEKEIMEKGAGVTSTADERR